MLSLGASKKRIVAKLAGGAQMFTFTQGAELNAYRSKKCGGGKSKLESLDIPVVSEDTGGNYGRTVELDSESGMLLIRTIGYGTKQI